MDSVPACLHCRSPLEKKRKSNCCSKTCYNSFHKAKNKRICEACGKEFHKKSQGHHGIPKYCSMHCQKTGRTKKTAIKCNYCGDSFLRKPCQIARSRYCSKTCMNKAMETAIEIRCALCERKFLVIKTREATARFCSHKCQHHFKGETGIEKQAREALDTLGLKYKQEYQYWRYRLDFFLYEFNVDLELDGLYWHDSRHDARRDARLLSRGIRTIRITDAELRNNDVKILILDRLNQVCSFKT